MKFADFVHLRGLTAVAAYLNLGTIATQDANAVAITGGTILGLSVLQSGPPSGYAAAVNSIVVQDSSSFYGTTIEYSQTNPAILPNALYVAARALHNSGTVSNVAGLNCDGTNEGSGDADAVNGAYFTASQFGAGHVNKLWAFETFCWGQSGTTGEAVGVRIDSNLGTITNNYGIFIEDQTAGSSSNFAIKTGLGLVSFGDAVNVPDEVYGSGWNGSLQVPTKNAVYDKIQTFGTAALLASDTDTALAANSDVRLATQKAVKAYVDSAVTGGASDVMIFKGVIDASANPNYPAADAGNLYKISVAGKIGGASGINVEVGDTIYCLTDSTASGNQATVGANWNIAQVNVDGAVIGPASATDGHVALFNGSTGKIIKDTGLTLSGTNTGDQTSVSGNAGTATALATGRSLYGNNFDGTADLSQIIGSAFGGTGNGFTKFTGPASSEKTFTLPNASASLAILAANTFTAAQTNLQSIAAVSTDGWVLSNTTAAAVGAQQWSPRLHFTGQGWKTTATAASQTVDWIAELQPVQGTTNPSSNLVFSASINGGAYVQNLILGSGGQVTVTNGLALGGGTQSITAGTDAQIKIVPAGGGGNTVLNINGTNTFYTAASRVSLGSAVAFGWTSTTDASATADTFLTRPAVATVQQGAAAAASPVAQTLQAQGSRAGTDSNVGGANYTWQPGTGTGTGTAASAIISAPTVAVSGTGAQTIAEICRFNTTTGVTVKSGVALQLGNAAVTGLAAGVLAATTNATLTITDSAGQVYRVPCII